MAPLTARAVAEYLLTFKSFLLVSHHSPDMDAYGSILGLSHGLKSAGKEVRLFNIDGVRSSYYHFLPGITDVADRFTLEGIDAVVVCDCGDARRVGDTCYETITQHPVVINIDHHTSNTKFGSFNYVVEEASSTSELIAEILEETSSIVGRNVMTSDAALCLYAGISADTGSFRFTATKAATFLTAARLVAYGAEPATIADALYAQTSPEAIKLQGAAFSQIRYLEQGTISVIVVDEPMLQQTGATIHDTEDIAERARAIAGVKVAAFIREEDGLWKVSLRSKSSDYDISIVAREFGGGGHKCAAGFRWRKTRDELEQMLLPRLQRVVER